MKIPITCAQNQEELFDVMPTPQFDRSDNVLYNPPNYLFEANNAEKTKFAVLKRKDAHKTGAWHRAIGIWLYNDHGEVLLQLVADPGAGLEPPTLRLLAVRSDRHGYGSCGLKSAIVPLPL